jgi:hypothetical protein
MATFHFDLVSPEKLGSDAPVREKSKERIGYHVRV